MRNEFRSSISHVVVARGLTVFAVGGAVLELFPASGFRLANLLLAIPLLLGAGLLVLFATVRVRGGEIECRWFLRRSVVRISEVRDVRVEIPHLAASLSLNRRVLPLGKLYFLLDKGDGPLEKDTAMLRYLKKRVGHKEETGN